MSAYNCKVGKIFRKHDDTSSYFEITYSKRYGLNARGYLPENISANYLVVNYPYHPAIKEFVKDTNYKIIR